MLKFQIVTNGHTNGNIGHYFSYFVVSAQGMGVIENRLPWYHSGFHVYIGDRITPSDKTGLCNLASYILRACFSQERMIYVPAEDSTDGIAIVIYTSKDRKSRKDFTALGCQGGAFPGFIF